MKVSITMSPRDGSKIEVAAMWSMKKVIVIPIAIGVLRAVSKELDKWIEKI